MAHTHPSVERNGFFRTSNHVGPCTVICNEASELMLQPCKKYGSKSSASLPLDGYVWHGAAE